MTESISDILNKLDNMEKNIQDIRSELSKTNQDVQTLANAQKQTQEEIINVIGAAEIVSKLGDTNLVPISKPRAIAESPKPQPKAALNVESPRDRFIKKYINNGLVLGTDKNFRQYFHGACVKFDIKTLSPDANQEEMEEYAGFVYDSILAIPSDQERGAGLKKYVIDITK